MRNAFTTRTRLTRSSAMQYCDPVDLSGSRDEDLDPRALREILTECEALGDEGARKATEYRSPVYREVHQKGTHARHKITAQHIFALHGITGIGKTEIAAADAWIDAAMTRLNALEVAA